MNEKELPVCPCDGCPEKDRCGETCAALEAWEAEANSE